MRKLRLKEFQKVVQGPLALSTCQHEGRPRFLQERPGGQSSHPESSVAHRVLTCPQAGLRQPGLLVAHLVALSCAITVLQGVQIPHCSGAHLSQSPPCHPSSAPWFSESICSFYKQLFGLFPGIFRNLGIEPASLASPALAGSLSHCTTWEKVNLARFFRGLW